MVKLQVVKNMVSYGGKIYESGKVFEVKDNTVARRIVMQTKGNVVEYKRDETKLEEEEVDDMIETEDLNELPPLKMTGKNK